MNRNLTGLLLSLVLIGLAFAASYLVSHGNKDKNSEYNSEFARKTVHIGVSNWFFVYYYFFDSYLIPVISLSIVAVANIFVNSMGGFGVLMGQESKKRNMGLVYYPVSIIMMIVLEHCGIGSRTALGCGLLGMGYGDGLAAITGMMFGKRHISKNSKKTWTGFITMFAVVTLITFLLNLCMSCRGITVIRLILVSILTGTAASLAEAFTPYGFDNITVPLVIFFLSESL